MIPRSALLNSRAVLRISGADAKTFLQGLISNDIENVKLGAAIFAALLSAQGKIQFDFLVLIDADGSYLLDIEAARSDELIRKLKLYRLRAKVAIEMTELVVGATFETQARRSDDAAALSVTDPRLSTLGRRFYAHSNDLRRVLDRDSQLGTDSDYAQHRLSLGVPEGASELGAEQLFLLEANAEELNGVDFQKGCYVGQELTSRMKRKTELKKRLLPFLVPTLPSAGTPLRAGERELGQTVGGRHSTAFVLVRLDRLAEAGGHPLQLGELTAELKIPSYLQVVLNSA